MQIFKTVKNILVNACAFGTLISLLFCLFIKATDTLSKPAMSISQYLIILLFGLFIACSNLLFHLKSIPKPLVYLIHYLALLVSFYVIFILISQAKFPTSGQLFVGLVLFSLSYGVVLFFSWAIRRILFKRNPSFTQKENTENYKPLYR